MARKKSNPFSALNAIEGVDLSSLVTTDEATGLSFLPVKDRISWFKTVHKDGAIIPEIVSITDSTVIMSVSVYLDKNDEKPVSKAHFSMSLSDAIYGGSKAISSAESCAVGRALAFAGFGCQVNSPELESPLPDAFIKEPAEEKKDVEVERPVLQKSLEEKIRVTQNSMNSVRVSGTKLIDGKYKGKTLKEVFKIFQEKNLNPNIELEAFKNPTEDTNNSITIAAAVRYALEGYNKKKEQEQN